MLVCCLCFIAFWGVTYVNSRVTAGLSFDFSSLLITSPAVVVYWFCCCVFACICRIASWFGHVAF